MSNGKKNNDDQIKPDMSFQDALKLAANTPPSMKKRLNFNDRTELKGVGGRIIEFVSIEINDKSLHAGSFIVRREIVVDNVISPKEFATFNDRYAMDKSKVFFVLEGNNPRIEVNKGAKMYITIKPPIGLSVKYCTLNYLKHTRH